MKGMYGLDVLAKLREMDPAARVDRRVGRRADLVARAGAGRRGVRVHQQARGARAGRATVEQVLEGRVVVELTADPAGRAHRAAEHRVRPRRRVAVAADRPPRAARSAAGLGPPDRRAERGAAAAARRRGRERAPDLLRSGRRRRAADPRLRRRRDAEGAADRTSRRCRCRSTRRRGRC